jgi:hypothetical protein
MGILLAFAPFIAFAVLERLAGSTIGLLAGMAVSAILVARDVITPGRSAKILEIGTVILFAALSLYTIAGGANLSVIGVRLCVDAGLLAIVLLSILVGQPFTLQYARETVAKDYWSSPSFVRANYVISAVWALAFLIMVLAELALLYLPELSPRIGVIAIIAALVGAMKFTSWYPERLKSGP